MDLSQAYLREKSSRFERCPSWCDWDTNPCEDCLAMMEENAKPLEQRVAEAKAEWEEGMEREEGGEA